MRRFCAKILALWYTEIMKRKRHNPEKKQFRGVSHRTGRRVAEMRERIALRLAVQQ